METKKWKESDKERQEALSEKKAKKKEEEKVRDVQVTLVNFSIVAVSKRIGRVRSVWHYANGFLLFSGLRFRVVFDAQWDTLMVPMAPAARSGTHRRTNSPLQ